MNCYSFPLRCFKKVILRLCENSDLIYEIFTLGKRGVTQTTTHIAITCKRSPSSSEYIQTHLEKIVNESTANMYWRMYHRPPMTKHNRLIRPFEPKQTHPSEPTTITIITYQTRVLRNHDATIHGVQINQWLPEWV